MEKMIGLPSVFAASDYQSYLRAALDAMKQERPRGEISRLARHMKCHPTFLSQVCRGIAHFSDEQALRLTGFLGLGQEDKEYFLNLLHRDRASDAETRGHFESRLQRTLKERSEIDTRFKDARQLTEDQERRYYQSWLTQAVHMACMFPGPNTPTSVATQLGVPENRVEQEFSLLIDMELICKREAGYQTTEKHVHLMKDSPMLKQFHLGWRIKALETLDTSIALKKNTHYSAAVALSTKAVASIQGKILDLLEETKKIVAASPEEQIYLFNIDFCSIAREVDRL